MVSKIAERWPLFLCSSSLLVEYYTTKKKNLLKSVIHNSRTPLVSENIKNLNKNWFCLVVNLLQVFEKWKFATKCQLNWSLHRHNILFTVYMRLEFYDTFSNMSPPNRNERIEKKSYLNYIKRYHIIGWELTVEIYNVIFL